MLVNLKEPIRDKHSQKKAFILEIGHNECLITAPYAPGRSLGEYYTRLFSNDEIITVFENIPKTYNFDGWVTVNQDGGIVNHTSKEKAIEYHESTPFPLVTLPFGVLISGEFKGGISETYGVYKND